VSDDAAEGCIAIGIIVVCLLSVGVFLYFLWAVAQAALKYANG